MSDTSINFIPTGTDGVYNIEVSIVHLDDINYDFISKNLLDGVFTIEYDEVDDDASSAGTYVNVVNVTDVEAENTNTVEVIVKKKNGDRVKTTSPYPD